MTTQAISTPKTASGARPARKKYAKNYYNDIALRLSQKLMGLEYLHYGFFPEGLEQTLANLPLAQKKFVEKILAHIPKDGVKTVLDIGCGAGGVAKSLVDAGYRTTCVDPDPFMTGKASEATGGRVATVNDLYENVTELTPESFDLVLMSESCQYIDVDRGFLNHARHLRTGGYVMAVDFFKIRELDQPYLSKSGHVLTDFLAKADAHGFELLEKVDITRETAPTMDIYQDFIRSKVFPVGEAVAEYVQRKSPFVYKILNRAFGKKVRFIRVKYDHQDSKTFAHYKGYFLLVFRKR